ncbi:DUF4304 domain-containing protein [Nocardioides sp. LML1-1-1.1]|uniref:DUF4304 domain-containing protein n=1 Tax=Nocardioides sp. LML1-1-1.1 TaxID=3135248 RepID=UPI00342C98B6
MAELEERLVLLVDQCVTPVLKPRGYRKRRLEWTRVDGDVAHRITLQRSHGNAPGHLRFYVEAAAYVGDFARRVGHTVPDDVAKATAPYTTRFERVTEWPGQWVDLEDWADDALHPAFRAAVEALAAHLEPVTHAEALADLLRAEAGPLNLDLFAWSCANGDEAAMAAQVARAEAEFGAEDRWPRLYAQLERTAERYGSAITPSKQSSTPRR